MSNPAFLKAHLVLVLLCVPSFAQTSPKKDAASQDFSKEGAVFEQITTRVVFQSDGTYTGNTTNTPGSEYSPTLAFDSTESYVFPTRHRSEGSRYKMSGSPNRMGR